MQRMEFFSSEDIQTIHQATLEVLNETGVEFPSQKSRDVFQQHGFRVEGEKVFITADQLAKALATAPSEFTVRARNPQNSFQVGGGHYVLAPSAGAPQVSDAQGLIRPASLEDYAVFAKLVQTSPINMPVTNGMCSPQELNPDTYHLDMFLIDLTYTDRAIMGSTSSTDKVQDTMDLLALVFGGKDEVLKGPCSLNVINAFTPLKYADDQSEALMIMAAHNQPVAVTNMMMLGATAPVSVPEALVLGNAELLAGLVLAQLVRPGVPVLYGSTSCPMDMKSMVAILGSPEAAWLSRGAIALADFYHLPCRTGGSLTDSHRPDAQALLDGSLIFQNALYSGASFIFHSFGMMSSYMAISPEKFVIDEEMAGLAQAAMRLPEVKNLDISLIKTLGSKGDYLTQPSTVKGFRKLYRSKFLNRGAYDVWEAKGRPDTAELARQEVARRVAAWEKPAIDPKLEEEIKTFVARKKKEANRPDTDKNL